MEHLTWSKHFFHNVITYRLQYLYQVPFSTQTQEDLPPPKQRKTFQYPNKGRKQTFQPTKEENKMPALKKRKKTKLPAHKQRRKTKLPALFLILRLFVGSAWSFVFFIPATTANDLRLRRSFYPRFDPLHFICPILILEKESVFSLVNFQC